MINEKRIIPAQDFTFLPNSDKDKEKYLRVLDDRLGDASLSNVSLV